MPDDNLWTASLEAHRHIPPAAEQRVALATDARRVQRAMLWGTVAMLALVVLLTSLMSQLQDVSWGESGVRLIPRLPAPLVYALAGLFVLSALAVLAVLFPAELRFRRKKPQEFQLSQEPPKVSWGVYVTLVLVMLLPIGLVVWLYCSGWQPPGAEQGQQQAIPPVPMTPLSQAAPSERPTVAAPGFAWTLFILAAVVGLGMLGGGAWILFGDRIEGWWYSSTGVEEARQALLNAVEISLDDLLQEPDPRRAVITCYHRFEQVLEQHGLPRAPWQTPIEYLHVALRRFRLPTVCLRDLTTLFEFAKFSIHALGPGEKQAAIEALRTVKVALEETNYVPPT